MKFTLERIALIKMLEIESNTRHGVNRHYGDSYEATGRFDFTLSNASDRRLCLA